jgi:peptidoglycan biosynthesis protein MviN/MurJ (putative lipid II flippase)
MAALLWWFGGDVAEWLAAPLVRRVLWLAALVGGGVGVYFVVLLALGVRVSHFRMLRAAAK